MVQTFRGPLLNLLPLNKRCPDIYLGHWQALCLAACRREVLLAAFQWIPASQPRISTPQSFWSRKEKRNININKEKKNPFFSNKAFLFQRATDWHDQISQWEECALQFSDAGYFWFLLRKWKLSSVFMKSFLIFCLPQTVSMMCFSLATMPPFTLDSAQWVIQLNVPGSEWFWVGWPNVLGDSTLKQLFLSERLDASLSF